MVNFSANLHTAKECEQIRRKYVTRNSSDFCYSSICILSQCASFSSLSFSPECIPTYSLFLTEGLFFGAGFWLNGKILSISHCIADTFLVWLTTSGLQRMEWNCKGPVDRSYGTLLSLYWEWLQQDWDTKSVNAFNWHTVSLTNLRQAWQNTCKHFVNMESG